MSHLLLVDDDEDIRSLLTSFFRKHGHTVSTAANGAEMFAALQKHAVDIVILDVMLQEEDGFSLCRRLRTTSPVPVIMLTGMADPTDRVVGLEIGADDYLTKPFDQRELLARVRAVLRRTAEKTAAPARSDTRPMLYFAGWRLDVARRELRSADNVLVLLTSRPHSLARLGDSWSRLLSQQGRRLRLELPRRPPVFQEERGPRPQRRDRDR